MKAIRKPNGRHLPARTAFGLRLRFKRLAAGLTLCELADLADVNFSAISHWERGRRQPTLANVRKLASGLGCDMADLLD